MSVAAKCDPIGTIRSPWPDRFGIPRQAGLVATEAVIELDPRRCPPEAVRGLEAFSHVWVIFWCHAAPAGGPTVRPPRLGGNVRVGVLASRSPVRPNPIGLSAVELVRVERDRIVVRGGDFLDGTPVLDIKPYLPWCDALPHADAAWAAMPPSARTVRWSESAAAALRALPGATQHEHAIEAAIALDPRPAYRGDDANDEHRYGMRFADLDVVFRVEGDLMSIEAVKACNRPPGDA